MFEVASLYVKGVVFFGGRGGRMLVVVVVVVYFLLCVTKLLHVNCTHLFKVNNVWNFLEVNLLTC